MSSQRKPSIVFCHGIWADGSCFSKVIPALQEDGHEVISAQYGMESFEEDVATIKRTLNRVSGPVLLVGHSYGGATITAAGVDDRVAGLVYIAAVAPDVGETVQDQLDEYPSDIFSRVEVADGCAWMLPNGIEFFCGDLSEQEQKLVWATHFPPVADLFQQQKIKSTPWKVKPSWYIPGDEGPHRASRSPALGFEAHGSNCDGGGKQPRSNALQAGRSHRGDSQSRKSHTRERDNLSAQNLQLGQTVARRSVFHRWLVSIEQNW
jgi:pimeloyl-ACP methyl ester carboxylesterase